MQHSSSVRRIELRHCTRGVYPQNVRVTHSVVSAFNSVLIYPSLPGRSVHRATVLLRPRTVIRCAPRLTMPPAIPNENTPLLTKPKKPPLSTNSETATSTSAQPAQNAAVATQRVDTSGIDWRRMFRFIAPYLMPQTWRLKLYAIASLFCIVLSKLCNLVPPFALKWAVDALAANATKPVEKAVAPLFALLVYFLGRVGNGLFGALRSITYSMVSMESTRRFSVDIFRHLQNLDISYHMTRKTGEINRIMDRGADSIDTLMSTFLFTLAPTYVHFPLRCCAILHCDFFQTVPSVL